MEKLEKIGDIYLDTYKGWYSIRDESFIAENEITINKNNEKVGPSGDILKWLEEPSYFFKLSKWQNKLLQFYSDNPDFIKPKSRYNEVIKFVEAGLQIYQFQEQVFHGALMYQALKQSYNLCMARCVI